MLFAEMANKIFKYIHSAGVLCAYFELSGHDCWKFDNLRASVAFSYDQKV